MKFSMCISAMLLAALLPNQMVAEDKELSIGSKAPAIDIEHWVSDNGGQFPHVTEFKQGKVYIVEFWATWCGPCVASMPEIKELQEEFASKGVQVISVSDEPLETVEKFLKRNVRGEEEMTYAELTRTYCLTTDPDSSVYEDYMKAANQNGIPTAFLVGKTGLVEWIGHPMELREVLTEVLDGTWDRESFAKEFSIGQKLEKSMRQVFRLLAQKKDDEAMKLIDDLIKEAEGAPEMVAQLKMTKLQVAVSAAMENGKPSEALATIEKLMKDEKNEMLIEVATSMKLQISVAQGGAAAVAAFKEAAVQLKDQPEQLNGMAWTVVEMVQGGEKVDKAVIGAATEAAAVAAKSAPKDASVLDTYANLLYLNGELDKAIEVQTQAVEIDSEIPEITSFLERLKKEKAEQGNGKDK